MHNRTHYLIRPAMLVAVLSSCVLFSGCSSLRYYSQSVRGHFEVMQNRQVIDALVNDDTTDAVTRDKLSYVQQLLDFARNELHLPDNGSYASYSDIKRDFVIWNVFATPELSLQPKTWCYWLVGCLAYRGYYAKQDAHRLAQQLKATNHDVFVGGVAAYSTLGWFRDPVLNTMLRWDKLYLAKVILHELAHQKLYVRHDTEFNEAFAETVAIAGLRRWLVYRQDHSALDRQIETDGYDQAFAQLVIQYKNQLEQLYASNLALRQKRQQKKTILESFRQEYFTIRKKWVDYDAYDNWVMEDLNNAKLAAVSTYRQLVPDFMRKLQQSENNLPHFYTAMSALAKCSIDQRRQLLQAETDGEMLCAER